MTPALAAHLGRESGAFGRESGERYEWSIGTELTRGRLGADLRYVDTGGAGLAERATIVFSVTARVGG